MWSLAKDTHHLNHGSFGAVPLPVQERQAEWRARWEANTTIFVLTEMQPALDEAREVTARFVGADPAGVVFVRNATSGIASAVSSIQHTLGPGDELLTTSHDYNAIRQTLEHAAERTGARVVVADIPFPVAAPSEASASILRKVTGKTRLAVIDHVTSPTALVLPIEDLVDELEPGIPMVVDGAHGPGQVPLSLDELGASWYAGNLHKWTCAPKGAAFLHTRADRVEETVSVVISHGRNAVIPEGRSRYWALFDWLGTDDMTPWLTVPQALSVVGALEPGRWPALMARNHDLAMAGRAVVAERLGINDAAPAEMIGSMAAVPLPAGAGPDPASPLSPLMFDLADSGFEVLVMVWPEWPGQVLRISAHHYNTLDEYQALAGRLSELVG